MEILQTILTNVLTALYQPFWFAVLFSITVMYVLMYAKEHGWKESVRRWVSNFRFSTEFRRTFALTFYTVMILFRTLLNRSAWMNPVAHVIGQWGIYDSNGNISTEPIENFILFVPFTIFFLWVAEDKVLKDFSLFRILVQSIKLSFLFSLTIELMQLFFFLGTFQLSDLFYNTLGGAFGGLVYWISHKIKHKTRVKDN